MMQITILLVLINVKSLLCVKYYGRYKNKVSGLKGLFILATSVGPITRLHSTKSIGLYSHKQKGHFFLYRKTKFKSHE